RPSRASPVVSFPCSSPCLDVRREGQQESPYRSRILQPPVRARPARPDLYGVTAVAVHEFEAHLVREVVAQEDGGAPDERRIVKVLLDRRALVVAARLHFPDHLSLL